MIGAVAVLSLAGAGLWAAWDSVPLLDTSIATTDPAVGSSGAEAREADVRQFCGACHASPDPTAFPRSAWPEQVAQGYHFFGKSPTSDDAPVEAAVVRYFENRAPEALPVLVRHEPTAALPVRFQSRAIAGGHASKDTGIANIRLLKLARDGKPEVVACDMNAGLVLAARPGGDVRVLSTAARNPGHAEAVDLDRDGVMDLLVADLGTPRPSDDRRGAVIWLKGKADGTYESIKIATKLGRVADVQAADFDGDGDLDLIAAEFGWRDVGSIVYLENRTGNDGKPDFRPTTLDPRHGAIHVPIADLDGDGKPDFVALISQEYETVVAFLNRGPGQFERKTIYSAPHPAFGLSGMQLVDLDGDGDLDALITNGDVFDTALLRPDNGVQWLENRGNLKFEPQRLAALYGAHRAQAADMDGDGDLDIVASSFLPDSLAVRAGVAEDLDSLILLEQTKPGVFTRHTLEAGQCHHPTLDLGDCDNDGRIDILLGKFPNFKMDAIGVADAKDPSASPPPPPAWASIEFNRPASR